ncbi:MAG: EamA family transporter [Dehalococcoidia bacterium]|nr:MAG: EamA family transporter [Dehalococcoidia bacterium]
MEGIWISIAILSAASIALVSIFDSHLISKRMPSTRSYLLIVSPIIMVSAIIIAFLFPLPTNVSFWHLVVAVISGLLRAVSVIILLYTLRREEVSRAVPVVSIYPVFVAIMAVPLLGETLNYLQGLAIAIVVFGVAIISIKKRTGNSTNWLGKTFFLLLSSSLLLASADVGSKYALEHFSFWNMYWISILCIATMLLVISLRKSVIKELTQIVRPRTALMLVVANEMLVVASAIMMFWAMERGPVSLVSTLTSTRPLFVVIYVLILSRFLPNLLFEGDLGRGVMLVRLVATAMIAGGIAIIYLV